MAQKIVFVHGIGDHHEGYSDSWRQSLDPHLSLPPEAYVETLWEPALDARAAAALAVGVDTFADAETTGREEDELRAQIVAVMEARKQALSAEAETERMPADEPVGTAGADVAVRGLLDWIANPLDSVGDFVRYLSNDSVRSQVKALVRDRLLDRTQPDDCVCIISHSWGTVVSYEMLHELAADHPARRIHTFVTLGSPLWMWPVRRLLRPSSGKKPPTVDFWVNVDAKGDLVGGWLHPDYPVDRDYAAPTPRGQQPHGSYFASENEAVLKDLLAHFILR